MTCPASQYISHCSRQTGGEQLLLRRWRPNSNCGDLQAASDDTAALGGEGGSSAARELETRCLWRGKQSQTFCYEVLTQLPDVSQSDSTHLLPRPAALQPQFTEKVYNIVGGNQSEKPEMVPSLSLTFKCKFHNFITTFQWSILK